LLMELQKVYQLVKKKSMVLFRWNDPIMETNCISQKNPVIYGYAAVPSNKTAIFDAGSSVFSC
jgi:hypothetical protein